MDRSKYERKPRNVTGRYMLDAVDSDSRAMTTAVSEAVDALSQDNATKWEAQANTDNDFDARITVLEGHWSGENLLTPQIITTAPDLSVTMICEALKPVVDNEQTIGTPTATWSAAHIHSLCNVDSISPGPFSSQVTVEGNLKSRGLNPSEFGDTVGTTGGYWYGGYFRNLYVQNGITVTNADGTTTRRVLLEGDTSITDLNASVSNLESTDAALSNRIAALESTQGADLTAYALTSWVSGNFSGSNHTHTGYAASDHTHAEYAAATHNHDAAYAASNHTHTGFAADNHTHTEYAGVNHNHAEYAAATHNHDAAYAASNHTHTGFAADNHTHTEYAGVNHNHDTAYAATNHTHTGYAATNHTHTEYAAATHNHDAAYAASNHTHTGFAADNHTHTEYAATNHTHAEYAAATHNHDAAYAASNHAHTEYAGVNHTHTGYAATNHTHAEYAAATHNHDAAYAAITHTHSTYAPITHSHEWSTLTGMPTWTTKFDYSDIGEFMAPPEAYNCDIISTDSITPSGDIVYNLGQNARRWKHVYAKMLHAREALALGEYGTERSISLDSASNLQVYSDWLPEVDNYFSLGSSNMRWVHGYFSSNVNVSNAIVLPYASAFNGKVSTLNDDIGIARTGITNTFTNTQNVYTLLPTTNAGGGYLGYDTKRWSGAYIDMVVLKATTTDQATISASSGYLQLSKAYATSLTSPAILPNVNTGGALGYDTLRWGTSYIDQIIMKATTADQAIITAASGALSINQPLNMNAKRVTNIATPTADTDAARKDYVDANDYINRQYVSACLRQFFTESLSYAHVVVDSGGTVTVYGDLRYSSYSVPTNGTVTAVKMYIRHFKTSGTLYYSYSCTSSTSADAVIWSSDWFAMTGITSSSTHKLLIYFTATVTITNAGGTVSQTEVMPVSKIVIPTTVGAFDFWW